MNALTLLAAPADGPMLGSIGAGGTALVLAAILFFGIRKGGKRKLPPNGALVVAFAAAIFTVVAGGIWAYPSQVVSNILAGITGGSSALGDIGPGAIAIVITVAVWYTDFSAKWCAVWGFVAAVVYGAAGGIWAMPIEIIRTAFASMGL
ncbi:hypothetical protein [Streptomyces macrosporus]|uniref:Uncharacterized protein n=1 Tax=Streptomyces macrosporus TaxID=44032 RepID=A0ABP5XIJ7_9ACTN